MKGLKLLLYFVIFSLTISAGEKRVTTTLKSDPYNITAAPDIRVQFIVVDADARIGEELTFSVYNRFVNEKNATWAITFYVADYNKNQLGKNAKTKTIASTDEEVSQFLKIKAINKTGDVIYYVKCDYKKTGETETWTTDWVPLTVHQEEGVPKVTWDVSWKLRNLTRTTSSDFWVGDNGEVEVKVTANITPDAQIELEELDLDFPSFLNFPDDDRSPYKKMYDGDDYSATFSFSVTGAGTGKIDANVDWEIFGEVFTDNNIDEISITAKDDNQSPVLDPITKRQTTEGTEVQIQLHATDPNGDVLTYSMPSGSTGSLNPSTGLFKWKPTLGQKGVYQIAFSVSDGRGGTDSETAEIDVKPMPEGIVDSWPISGNNIRVSLQPNSEFSTEIIVGRGHDIQLWSFGFNSSAGNQSSNFLVTTISPSGTKEEHPFSATSGNVQKSNPTTGTWKISIKNNSTENAELLLTGGVQSTKLLFQTIIYRKNSTPRAGLTKLAGSTDFWAVSWGVVTGVCSPDDWVCMSTDIGIGLAPAAGTVKDVSQLITGTLIGAGMEAVAFFTNNEEMAKTADDYFSSAGFASIGIAGLLMGAYYADELAKISKYGPRIAKLIWFTRKAKKLGDLPAAGEHFFKNSDRVKASTPIAKEFFDKAIEMETKDKGKAFEYDIMAKFLSDPEDRFEAVRITSINGDGVGTKFYAKMVPGGENLPDESLEKWDYSTVSLIQKEGYQTVTDLDVLVKDKQTGKLVGVQVKSGDYTWYSKDKGVWAENSDQLEKFRRAIKNSPEFRTQLGGNTVDDFETFGILGTELALHPKVAGSGSYSSTTMDTIFVHRLYPTVPILDWIKRNSSGKNTIKFHTLEESGNQGWWIQRRHVDSASYKVVSPIILGWMDSPEGHQYEFTDETSDSSQSYYYRIAQLNVTGYVTFVSDSIVMSKVTGVLEENMTPENIFLHQNYPNPFNPSTTLRYSLPSSSEVLIAVSDILGRKVSVLEEGIKSAGYHEIIWDAHMLPSGIYFAEIFVNGNSAGRIKMLLTK